MVKSPKPERWWDFLYLKIFRRHYINAHHSKKSRRELLIHWFTDSKGLHTFLRDLWVVIKTVKPVSNKCTTMEHTSVTRKWLVVGNRTPPGNPWGSYFPGVVLLLINKKFTSKLEKDFWASKRSWITMTQRRIFLFTVLIQECIRNKDSWAVKQAGTFV